MKRLTSGLILLLCACAATASDQTTSGPTDYEVYLAGIEKWRNHHNDSIRYTAPLTAAANNPDLKYKLASTKYRNTQGVPDQIALIVDGRFEQETFMDSAVVKGARIDVQRFGTDLECKAEVWCPTEIVRLQFTKQDLDMFSENGLHITFEGTAGNAELTMDADYFRAFRDSFTLPPEWTKSGGLL